MTKTTFLLIAMMTLSVFVGKAQQMDTLSYSLGVLVAQNLKGQGFDGIDGATFGKAVEDVLRGREVPIDVQKANAIVQGHVEKAQMAQYQPTIEAGKAFLAKNAKRPEVHTTASGLQYEVITEGTGPRPTTSDKVEVHYHGTLIDGTVFDSSVERGQPTTFGVTQVIPGWVEGLQLMPEGSKFKFYIPYDLAYGSRGAGPKIGPYSTLIFEVELLKIQ